MNTLQPSSRELSIWESGYLVAGRYEVVRCLGIGSMGVVYLCRHRALDGFLVALKVLSPPNSLEHSDDYFTARFKNEIAAVRNISHPNVVCVYDYVSEPGLEAYSMEYMRGGDLANYLRRASHLNLRSVVQMVIQMCAGVQAIHDANYMHRDIKPENFLLSGSRQIKISDFGIARSAYGPRLTAKGTVVGTVQYLSPEYLRSSEYSKQGDVYSLGTLAYEMICGALPFSGHNVFQTIELKLRSEPLKPSLRNPACPQALNAVVLKALNREPSERYQSAAEMGQDLQQVLKSEELLGSAGPRYVLNLPSLSEDWPGFSSSAFAQNWLRRLLARLPMHPPRHALRLGLIMSCGLLLGMFPVLFRASRLAKQYAPEQEIAQFKPSPAPADAPRPADELESTSPALLTLTDMMSVAPAEYEEANQASVPIEQPPEDESRVGVAANEPGEVPHPAPQEGRLAAPLSGKERKPFTLPTRPANVVKEVPTHAPAGDHPASQPLVERPPDVASAAAVQVASANRKQVLELVEESSIAPEFKVRATLLYRFADYVDWPPQAQLVGNAGFTICIKGSDPFGAFLDQAITGIHTKAGAALRVQRFPKEAGSASLSACQLLYLSDSKRSEVERTTAALRGKGVLVVSEDTGRGMINFVIRERKVKFEIDREEVQAAGFSIRQVLLDLAVNVR